jgi:hypothetical protein
MHRIALTGVLLAGCVCAGGGESDVSMKIAQAKKQLQPRPVVLQGNAAVDDFLTALAKQTGNVVVDRRQNKAKTSVAPDLDKVPFWQALDRFTMLAGCGYTTYGSDGGVALIDANRRSPHVSYHGITRTSLKRIAVVGDLETGVAQCIIHLDVAWEPRFEPFYLGVGPATALYAPRGVAKELKAQAPGRGQMPVAGRSASEVEIQLPAPPRQSPSIVTLEGSFKFLGPSKMLTFRFKEIKAGAALEQEEVSVRLLQVKEGPDRWLVTMQIDNPPGTPVFESFQSWLDNNRVLLVKDDDGKPRTRQPEPNETVDVLTDRKAVIEYAFAAPKGKTKLADWTLEVRTPGRIVELTVPYRFDNVPLP